MDIQDIENKEPLIRDFYTWLFDDNRISNKEVNLKSEEDLSLASFYCDSKIYYPEQIAKFFETNAMKRLSRVSQLGTAINNYPYAYHSRLEHSKGVYNRKLEEFLQNFENKNWRKYIEENNLKLHILAELIKISGHDIGHFPLSHAFEENIFNTHSAHEIIGQKIILEDSEIQEVLNSISPELSNIIKDLFEHDVLNFPEHDEGNFDVDRLDYIGRDSLYCGKLLNFKTYPYNTISVEVDENGKPIENDDLSIKTSKDSKIYIDVYDFSSLASIEEFLKIRFDNYKKIYMSKETKLSETSLKSFFNIFLSENQEIGTDLYNYLIGLKNVSPDEIDISEFLKWDDISFYSQIIEIAQNHEDKNVRDSATLLIPTLDNFLNLIYNLLGTSKENYSEEDIEFLQKIKEIITGNDEFSVNMRNQNFLYENAIVLDSSNENLDINYLYQFQYKLKGYNPRKNPIYIKDENGKIFELSNHPNQSIDWKNYTEILETPCIYLPDLRYHNVPEDEIQKLFLLNLKVSKINSNSDINMSQLQVGNKMKEKFLEIE